MINSETHNDFNIFLYRFGLQGQAHFWDNMPACKPFLGNTMTFWITFGPSDERDLCEYSIQYGYNYLIQYQI